jgi:hypothetical protein
LPIPKRGRSRSKIASSSSRRWSLEKRTSRSALANSLMARAFAPERPALRSLARGILSIRDGEIPPERLSTRLMIVAAAFVDSCCEMIEVASDRKLLSLRGVVPIGQ